ncbi:MAG: peptide deformylase [Arenicellales bacterium]|nr:peptide deformylase [Arenicellales bacterium]
MAILDVLTYPDPRLRKQADPVESVDDVVRQLVDDMAETMYAAPGIGLAAVQVNVPKRVIVIDISEDQSDLKVFINPEITEKSGEQESEEGCLSVPGVYAPVTRANSIVVNALDRNGTEFKLESTGMLAVCIQHEVDHLDGKVFVDYLSRLKQERIRKKLSKQARRQPTPLPSPAPVM